MDLIATIKLLHLVFMILCYSPKMKFTYENRMYLYIQLKCFMNEYSKSIYIGVFYVLILCRRNIKEIFSALCQICTVPYPSIEKNIKTNFNRGRFIFFIVANLPYT